MAVANLVDTTFTAKNISTALSVYEYTVPGTGLWYHLYFQVRLVQVAGGGDYTINLRLNDGDILADDPMVPKTTYTAAAGAQNIWFQGEALGGSGDVFNIMCLGLAGDTAVVGSIRILADDAVGATTYGATLDVTATGEAGLNFDNIKAASAPTTLTNITVPVVTTVTNAPTGMALEATLTAIKGVGWTVETLKAIYDQVVLRLLTTGYTAPPSVTQIADQVWDELIAGHVIAGSTGATLTTAASSGGATPATLWAYATRTLTQSAAQVIDIVQGSSITATRGDTLVAALTGIGALTNYVTLDFTVKQNKGDADTAAIIRIRKTTAGVGDGLQTINGAAGTAANGSLAITSLPLGNVTITLAAVETAKLAPGQGYHYDIQMITATTVQTMTAGTFNVSADVTLAIV